VNGRLPIGYISLGRGDPTSVGIGDVPIHVAGVIDDAVADAAGEHSSAKPSSSSIDFSRIESSAKMLPAVVVTPN
jgi:hypothetical protein